MAEVAERPLGAEGRVVGSEREVAEAIALDKFVAAGGGEPGDGGGDVIGVVEFDDAEIANVGELAADANAVAGFVGVGRGAVGGAGFGEESAVAETLGEFLGGDGRRIGGAGGGEGDGEKEREGYAEKERRRDGEKEKAGDAGDAGLGWHGDVETHDRVGER